MQGCLRVACSDSHIAVFSNTHEFFTAGTIIKARLSCSSDIRICRVATAFGGDKVLEGPSKWQIFDTEIVAKAGNLDWVQDISADGNMVIGSVIYDGIKLTIDLNDDWILYEGVNEPVKVEGLASEPSTPIPADKFRLYKGTDLSLDLSELRANGLRYYAIHLDVQTSNPANF